MRVFKSPLYIFLAALLMSSIFSGCGGGEGPSRTAPIVETADCPACHNSDIAATHDDTSTATQLTGYVLNAAVSWAPDGMGYVTKGSAKQCSASCHDYHNTDMKINRQASEGGHQDITAGAFTHSFSISSAKCLRCHSGIGYASYVDASNGTYPNWQTAPAQDIKTYPITCNACHDAAGYPSTANKRLRKTGSVTLTNSTYFDQEETLNVGNSAACLICHQGTESGLSLYKTMISKGVDPYNVTDQDVSGSAVSPHYFQAGAMLFSVKGYEFKYINGIENLNKYSKSSGSTHQIVSCTGCHMANSSDENFGGHSFKVDMTICQGCHLDTTFFEARRTAIEELKALVKTELESQGIYYYSTGSRGNYFFIESGPPSATNTAATMWKESQFEAAYNLLFVDKEPAAYIHNFSYAAQLLWDSCKALGVTPAVGRPSGDRTAKDYR